jgi:D-glycero-D-manno-heptose 1,7-bisphosphate phosphatase
MNFKTIVVTNQPDVARKLISQEVVEEIHRELTKKLCIDAFYVCWHDDKDECTCRKPRPGMLAQAAKDHGIDLCKSYMVGDRWRDVDAGAAVGCQTIFIDYGYQDQQPKKPDFISKSLAEAVVWIENDMEKYE